MTRDMDSESTAAPSPRITTHQSVLPLPGSKYAPRTLTSKRRPREVDHFLEDYDRVCSDAHLTDQVKKCERMTHYCSTKVAEIVETLPSYHNKDYDQLRKDLYYFLEPEDEPFSLSKIRAFIKKYHKKKMDSTKQLKQYHLKYLKLVGKAVSSNKMSEEDYDLYFWGGLPTSLQKKIENRLLTADTDLDAPKPFEMTKVIKLASFLLNRHRFDQHILSKSGYHSSDSESDSDDYKPKRPTPDSESESEEESEDCHQSRRPTIRRKSPQETKPSSKKEHQPLHTEDLDEVSRLIKHMNKLSIGQLSKADTQQKAYLADLVRKLVDQPKEQYHPPPPRQDRYQPREQPPQRSYGANQDRYPSRDPPPHQQTSYQPNRYPSRDPPPHQQPSQPPRQFQERPDYCYGCGKTGHRVMNCGELNGLINQRIVQRGDGGRLQWPDGSPVYKDRDDTFVQAINKNLKRANIVQATWDQPDDEDEVKYYVGVTREESDASTESQEELGWTPGPVGNYHSLGAERSPRISKDTRRQVQFHPPGIPQGMKNLPERRDTISDRKQKPSIHQTPNHHSNQPSLAKRITPFDPNEHKFEAKRDNQLLPMEVDQGLTEKPSHNSRKVVSDQERSNLHTHVANPRSNTNTSSLEMVDKIMNTPITVTVAQVVHTLPAVRRDLTHALKVPREVLNLKQEGKGKDEKSVLGLNALRSLIRKGKRKLGKSRDGLMKVSTTIGNAKITGVFDSGSQVNVMSDKYVGKCGLPITTEGAERYRISGVNGGLAEVVGIIPDASIHLTDSKVETIGELVVVKHSGFDLLLGRPWGTMNGAGMREAPEGTYLSFDGEGVRYEVMASPNPDYASDDDGVGFSWCCARRCKPEEPKYILAAAQYDEEANIPDSEEDRNELDYTINVDNSIPIEWETEGDRAERMDETDVFAEEIAEEERGWERDNEDEAPEQFPDERPSGNLGNTDEERGKTIVIETELQESFIKMVQEGTSDEAEWELFCAAERRRKKEEKDRWRKWKREREAIKIAREAKEIEREPLTDAGNQSETLRTPEPEQRPRGSTKRMIETDDRSVITAARRSGRVRTESRKARESEDWQKWKKRVYEREAKLTRKTVRNSKDDPTERVLRSFGAQLNSPTRDEQGPDKILSPEDNKPEAYQKEIDSGEKVIKEGKEGQEEVLSEEIIRRTKWPPIGDCKETTYRKGNLVIRERRLQCQPQSWEESVRERPLRQSAEGWRIGPGDGTFDPKITYPWVSREEMEKALKYVRRMPESKERRFTVRAIGPDKLAITLEPKERMETPTERLESQRMIELKRGRDGSLDIIPRHTIACATHTSEGRDWTCPGHEPPDDEPRGTHLLHDKLPPTQHSGCRQIEDNEDDRRTPEAGLMDRPTKQALACRLEWSEGNKLESSSASAIHQLKPENGPRRPTQKVIGHEVTFEALETEAIDETSELASPINMEPEIITHKHLKPEGYQERTYQFGKTLYVEQYQRRMTKSPEEIDRMRLPEELPDWDEIHDEREEFDANKQYPMLSREELGSIIEWADTTPEYRDGGHEFLIHKTPRDTIAITLIGRPRSPTGHQERTRVLEITRSETGQLQSTFNRSSIPYEGPLHSAYEYLQRVRDKPTHYKTTDEDQEQYYTAEEKGTGDNDDRPETKLQSLVTRREPEPDPRKERRSQRDDDSKGKTRSENYLQEGPPNHTMDDSNPECYQESENEPNLRAAFAMGISFPSPQHIKYLPTPQKRSNGLLAIRRLVPFTQYDQQDDIEYYGQGVTLAYEDDEGRTTYHRGNAIIRITDRDVRPGPKPPSRQRVNHLRKHLFRLREYARREEEEQEENLPAPDDSTQPRPNDDQDQFGSRETRRAVPKVAGHRDTMTREELGAIVGELMEDPIEEDDGRRAYELEVQDNGTILATRVPVDPKQWRRGTGEPIEETVSNERMTERPTPEADPARLTQYGSDPPTSDQSRVTQAHSNNNSFETQQRTVTPDVTEVRGAQPRKENPLEIESSKTEVLAAAKTIKQTRLTRQDISGNSPVSHSTPNISTPTIPLSPNCLKPMGLASQTQAPPKEFASYALLRAESPPAPTASPLGATNERPEDDIYIPPCPDKPRPGILAAAHLGQLQIAGSNPREPSFFAYGSTIALEDADGQKLTFRGNALVHLYALSTPNSANSPRPPHPGRTELAKAYLFGPKTTAILSEEAQKTLTNDPRPMARLPGNFQFNPNLPMSLNHLLSTEQQSPLNLLRPVDIREPDRALRPAYPPPISAPYMPHKEGAPTLNHELTRDSGRSEPSSRMCQPLRNLTNEDTHLIADENPALRQIQFVHGGVIPGTCPTDSLDRPASRMAQLRHELMNETTRPPTARKYEHQVKITGPTHAMLHRITEDAMDVSRDDEKTPESLPDLSYPPRTPTPQTAADAANKEGHDANDGELETYPIPSHEEPPAHSDAEEEGLPDALRQYNEWQTSITDLKEKIEDHRGWEHEDVTEVFGNLGLLQWWYDAKKEREAGRKPRWGEWKEKVVKEWQQRYPAIAPYRFAAAAERLKEVRTEPRKLRSLVTLIRAREQEDEDEDMSEPDVPPTPRPTPIPLPVPPPTPIDPMESTDSLPPLVPAENDGLKDLREQVEELEGRLEGKTTQLRSKIERMDRQLDDDAVLLAELKWKVGEITEEETAGRTTLGKRSYRKAKDKPEGHRYPTRYKDQHAHDNLEPTQHERKRIHGRIQKIEDRMEEMKEEVERHQKELAEAETLAPKIDRLTATLDSFCAAQIKVNLGTICGFARIQALCSENIMPRLDTHAQDLTNLNARFNMLYSLALTMIGKKAPPHLVPTFQSVLPHQIPPFMAPIRSDQPRVPSPLRQITDGRV